MTSARQLLVTALLALLAACGGGGGSGQAPTEADAGTTVQTSINSAQTQFGYALDIWLPPEYASGTARFPVVYAMDCEYRFNTLVTVMQQRHAQGRTPAILVNVCAGGSPRRWVDFTMPGAAAYLRFLTQELLPMIDGQYRTDPTQRILSGHSLSGEFALYALYLDDPAQRHFQAIISEECSCWYDASMLYSQQLAEPAALEQAMYDASPVLPVTLVMAGDTLSNQPAVLAVYNRILARNYQGLRLAQPVYSLGHNGMDGPAYADGLSFAFNGR